MSPDVLLDRRLINQHIGGRRFTEPHEVVAHLGAVQAQEYAMAKWALALRLPPGATNSSVERALDRGAILRTHVLRSTWHFVAPADLRWILALTAPRIRAQMAWRHRELEIDSALVKRVRTLVTRALRGGQHLSRNELGAVLRRGRVVAEGERLGHLMILLELDALVCSGPRVGRQFTYALVDERVPAARPLDRDAALAALARRYFASRGPATAHDFAWWSGLTVTDARRGIDSLDASFARETIAGRQHVFPSRSPASRPPLADFFIPDYDEYGIAYKDRQALFARAPGGRPSSPDSRSYNRFVAVDGRAVASWRRVEAGETFAIDIVPFAPLSRQETKITARCAHRFAAFYERSATLSFQPAARANEKGGSAEPPV